MQNKIFEFLKIAEK